MTTTYGDELLAPTTAAKSGSALRFFVRKQQVPYRISCTGLAGTEKYALKLVDGDKTNPIVTVAYKDGAAITYTATAPSGAIWAPGYYQLDKDATASASGVYGTAG